MGEHPIELGSGNAYQRAALARQRIMRTLTAAGKLHLFVEEDDYNLWGPIVSSDIDTYVEALNARISHDHDPLGPLLDLGGGTGSVGAQCAARSGARAVNLDVARFDTDAIGEVLPRWRVQAQFESLPFRQASFSGALAVDSVYLSNALYRALSEIHRVLLPYGGFVFTSLHSAESGDHIQHWKTLVEPVGFDFTGSVDLTANWRAAMQRRHRLRWDHRTELREELGSLIEPELTSTARMLGMESHASVISRTRRTCLIFGRRPEPATFHR